MIRFKRFISEVVESFCTILLLSLLKHIMLRVHEEKEEIVHKY